MDEHGLILIRTIYSGSFLGIMAFLLLWEGGEERVPFHGGVSRRTHLLRNFGMLFWVVVIADYVVGWSIFHTSSLLLTPLPSQFELYKLPWPYQLALGFLLSDLLDYFFHILCHRWGWLRRIHSVHHSDLHLDATTALRVHPIETSLEVAYKVTLYAVLGLPFWIEGVRAILHNALSMIQHANVPFPAFVERLRPIFITPELHRVQHDTQRTLRNSNYGVIFSFWDRLFGTYLAPEQVTLERVGLPGFEHDSWQSVTGMLMTPLRRLPGTESGM